MRLDGITRITQILLALAAVANTSPVTAVAQSAQARLPSVHDIHLRFIAAVGGRNAIMRPKSTTTRGYYDIFGPNGKSWRVSFVTYAAPFKQLEIDTVPGRGVYRSGYNDGVSWSLAPGGLPQLAKGVFLRSARRDADIYYWAHISDYFRSMDVVGIDTFAGRACYHLRGITNWGNENNQYFDTRTGLLAGYAFHQFNASGNGRESTVTQQIFEQYRNFDGLLIPMRTTTFDGGRLVNRLQNTSVEFDGVDDRVFDLPASVASAVHASK